VLFKKDEATGATLEPMEEVVIYVDNEYSGHVIENMANRKGEMKEMLPMEGDKLKMVFLIPSRGLIGYQSEFRNYTRGTGVMSRVFHSYGPYKGDIGKNRNGVIVSGFDGETTAYALSGLEDRGILFVGPKTTVYKGMIIGEHNKSNDIVVNPVKSKELTNMRAASADKAIILIPHKEFTLEETISYITDDELVEVTPKSIRLRKKNLNVK
jgi:GTP-binding protein